MSPSLCSNTLFFLFEIAENYHKKEMQRIEKYIFQCIEHSIANFNLGIQFSLEEGKPML